MRKLDTPAQRWARERNWNKRRLLSVRGTLASIRGDLSTVDSERGHIARMLWRVEQILREHKKNRRSSKSQFIRGTR